MSFAGQTQTKMMLLRTLLTRLRTTSKEAAEAAYVNTTNIDGANHNDAVKEGDKEETDDEELTKPTLKRTTKTLSDKNDAVEINTDANDKDDTVKTKTLLIMMTPSRTLPLRITLMRHPKQHSLMCS